MGNGSSGSQVSGLLERWRQGDAGALHELMPLVDHQLRGLARAHLAGERREHTLETAGV